jgi:hypothetical protein
MSTGEQKLDGVAAPDIDKRLRKTWLVVFGIIGIVLVLFFLPWLANQFGYALPMSGTLPSKVSYNGRTYTNTEDCFGSNCLNGKAVCRTQSTLERQGTWPLNQIGSVPTLLGAARPILVPAAAKQAQTPTVLFVQDKSDCYVVYGLQGGP